MFCVEKCRWLGCQRWASGTPVLSTLLKVSFGLKASLAFTKDFGQIYVCPHLDTRPNTLICFSSESCTKHRHLVSAFVTTRGLG